MPRADSLSIYTDVLPYPQDNWDGGFRQLVCVAYEPDPGDPNGIATRGSIKGSFQ